MLFIVGNRGGSNIGESFARSAAELGLEICFFEAKDAQSPLRIVNALRWRFCDRRPARLRSFAKNVLNCAEQLKPAFLMTTGFNPLPGGVIRTLRGNQIICLHFSTDDPWNPTQRANWFLRSLPEYDIVFTTRRRNINDFLALGCLNVQYTAFGYDKMIFGGKAVRPPSADGQVLFVGGADRERVDFMETLLSLQIPISLVGDYWERVPSMRRYSMGHKPPEEVIRLTQAAKVNLCLVRRANRDGHVMRSFEIAALGGCMVVEETVEHRQLFGADGECVLYFSSPNDAAEKIRRLLGDMDECCRLGRAVQARVVGGANTYTDRLASMLAAASEVRRAVSRI